MYLSRCEINPNRRGAKHLLGNPQAMHAAVLACFPRSLSAENGRVLWRVDHSENGVFLYVTSQLEPDFTVIQEQAGWLDARTAVAKSYDRFLDSLQDGQFFHFRLSANPVWSVPKRVRNAPHEEPRGKVKAHVTTTQQENWLIQRAPNLGFEICVNSEGLDGDITLADEEVPRVLSVVGNRTWTFTKGREEERRRVTLQMVTFEGVLQVTDADRLRETLVNGIGRGKAYGCGLLTLVPFTGGRV
ncbi:type I-E CRISPR-associated protein Cas6/Cse3/CasE [Schaalia sp. Marseille-Q2122]|uniref:type I-E CRISPR-associated protein Cas6/Cse3/CasE n=1 Tax=Schaalia sp. Marseille-Q2122 TaxID=2736604 RepID=UPI0015898721|nr:type I-E CRISPR-associated protein Cas6/Cse3/CasE [Schaalia sp. Marseille-Q2122]